ncbi:MAG: polyprenyl synthetase family protein [bacterium]|nr:MAG: polyprenyl synthetase family protein [bacterium]
MLDKIRKPIERELQEFENRFQAIIETDVTLIKEIFTHIVSTKGKRLRPMLLFLCSSLQGQSTEKTFQVANIVELLHTATLIHDDVVDSSEMRRGAPSVNSIWENKISVLIGDYLFAEVLYNLTKLSDLKMYEIISNITRKMSQGELLQMEKAYDSQMDEEIYFRLISNKTASLTAATCQLGGLTSTMPEPNHVENLRVFGESLGIAFQIKDDLLDYDGSEEKLGKPIGKDLLENIITLPVLYSLKQVDENTRKKVLSILEDGYQDQKATIVQFVKETGGLRYANQQAEFYIQKALKCLDRYADSPYKNSLILLSNFITSREV